MITQLVVNGCSYMETYAEGNGHVDLAQRLGLDSAHSLAIGGSCNNRIVRTTLKHAATNPQPSLYVLGMTFVSRTEIPILSEGDQFEGRWTNPQNQDYRDRWQPQWTNRDYANYIDLMVKWELCSLIDRLEDLMYRMFSARAMLLNLGHRVLMFQQADQSYQTLLNDSRLKMFSNCVDIVQGFDWTAVPWQHQQGVPPTVYYPVVPDVPPHLVHPAAGHHDVLNTRLTEYIREHKILA